MRFNDHFQLTYCTNIHPGEHWEDVFQSLKDYSVKIKQAFSKDEPFGLGLRLSGIASKEILKGNTLDNFKAWLDEEEMYVFTMNGFPYGGFHRQVVKDQVHAPDWTDPERRDYTLRLFDILAHLLPEGMEGGISTSPISYKYWFSDTSKKEEAYRKGVVHMIDICKHLCTIEEEKGCFMHLDIEPEPDGFLENTAEVLEFYETYLIPIGVPKLEQELGLAPVQAEKVLRRHVTICYDVCHFAVAYEEPREVFESWKQAGISVGKIQISAALQALLDAEPSNRREVEDAFSAFNESTYLHQVIALDKAGQKTQYPDLPEALAEINHPGQREWRSHFHVPLFVEDYKTLQSTQKEIVKTLNYIKENPCVSHLEVETYTWEVLPNEIRMDLTSSIVRELEWVVEELNK